MFLLTFFHKERVGAWPFYRPLPKEILSEAGRWQWVCHEWVRTILYPVDPPSAQC